MRYGFPKLPFLIFLPLFIVGITYVQIGQNESGQFLKIFVGFFLAVVFYHYVIELFEGNVQKLFLYYMKGAVIVSGIGIVQIISYQIGFAPGYNYGWLLNKWSVTQGGFGIRMNSIFSEPSYFAAVIAPAFFVALYNLSSNKKLFIDRKRSIIIGVAYLLTFSSLGIFGIYLAVLLLLLNLGFFRYAILFAPIFYYSFNYSYENIPEFRQRFDGTFDIFTTQDFRNHEIHGSSFVLYNNYHVALENFKRNPVFGTGLGSHPTAFEKYSLTKLEGVVEIDFNKQDANSMALRLMSETGLYGLVFMLVFIIKCWIFKPRAAETEVWVMSNALILIILLYLFRQGHYFLNGFPFFLWLFYYTWKDNRAKKAARSDNESEQSGMIEVNVITP
jgi:hypothetical protein